MASGKRVRAEVKRAEILKAATTLFLAHGYDSVSIDAIIEIAGGTKTNVYKLFGDKAALYAAVVDDLGRQMMESMAALETVPVDPQKPEESLRKLGYIYLEAVLTKRSLRSHRLVIAEAERFPGVARRWAKMGPDSATKALGAHFAKLQKSGRFSRLVPARLAGLFVDLLGDGLVLKQLAAGAKPLLDRDIKAQVHDAVAVFLNGITSR